MSWPVLGLVVGLLVLLGQLMQLLTGAAGGVWSACKALQQGGLLLAHHRFDLADQPFALPRLRIFHGALIKKRYRREAKAGLSQTSSLYEHKWDSEEFRGFVRLFQLVHP